ncbi:hypothetical protein HMPREF9062_0362 [Actinomyces sp. oral taxon 448 str. F0400]|nr:hypothetical protein HMPREF9062_0362 [Actinomyces sp. oral taxon 448 str. F0400]
MDNSSSHVDGRTRSCGLRPRPAGGNHHRPAGSTEPLFCRSTPPTRTMPGPIGLIPRTHTS